MSFYRIVSFFIFKLFFIQSYAGTLFVGDSHSYGPYGKVIDEYLRLNDNHVTSISVCGSSPSNWVKDSKKIQSTNCGYWKKSSENSEVRVNYSSQSSLEGELKDQKIDLVLVSLGTNIIGRTQVEFDRELKSVKLMIEKIKEANSKCIWLGPPDLGRDSFKKNLPARVAQLKNIVESNGCKFIDATRFTEYPSGKSDGIHYGPQLSRKWGEAVVEQLRKMSSSDLPVRSGKSNMSSSDKSKR